MREQTLQHLNAGLELAFAEGRVLYPPGAGPRQGYRPVFTNPFRGVEWVRDDRPPAGAGRASDDEAAEEERGHPGRAELRPPSKRAAPPLPPQRDRRYLDRVEREDMHRYLAFRWRGQTYYWDALPFGVAPACNIYTTLKQELFRPIRERGARMAFLIDDQHGAAAGRDRAAVQCWAVVSILAALGFTLSWSKCQLRPTQRAHFLGFIVDACKQVFEVPQRKVEALAQLVGQLEAAGPAATRRQAAQLAGKVLSMTPAVSQAPLHSRLVSRALAGQAGWDEALGSPAEVVAQARVFLGVLQQHNGRCTWHKGPAVQVRVVGDASDRAYAAYLPGHPELGQLRVPFTQQEWDRTQAHAFSSTARELGTIKATLQWLQSQAPRLLRHTQIQYQTDSQAASCCVLGMKGAGECLQLVADIYQLCAHADTEITTVWRPRGHREQQVADQLSKYTDGSQWLLNPEVYAWLLQQPQLQGRAPALDCFADAFSTKVPGAYYSRGWEPGTHGVDAFAQDWRPPAGQARPLLYINPPFGKIGQVLRKLQDDQPDCLLILPVWPRWWAALRLPVRAQWMLPHREDLCIPGPQVPGGPRRKPKAPRYQLRAVYICWQ